MSSLLGQMFGVGGKSNQVVKDLVSGYLQDEGRLEVEGRTIVYKAYLREFALPAVFDAIATDTVSGITALTSKEEEFDDAQDAYHKAVANLLAVLRQKGVMRDPNAKPEQTEEPTKDPEPKSEQSQNQEPELDPTPGGDSVSEPERHSPGPDSEIDESQSEQSDHDLEREMEEDDVHQVGQENSTNWPFVLQSLCTVVTTVILGLIYQHGFSPPKKMTVCYVGFLIVGIVFYDTFGVYIFGCGAISVVAVIFIEILQAIYKKSGLSLTSEEFWNQFESIIKPAVFVLEVSPDSQGSYKDHKMKPAETTKDMLNENDNYRMDSKCKGLAFILNNSVFCQCEQRKGSQVDTDNIKHLFSELGYKIILYENLKGKEIKQRFNEFASEFNKKDDSAVIVLMSHGNAGVILGTDDSSVELRVLRRELEPDKCPMLKGKPKMYFVQACRGKMYSVPNVAHDGPNPAATGVARELDQRRQELVPVKPDSEYIADIRDCTDTYFAYATMEGYISLRNEVLGSFFVKSLCEVFFAHAHRDNLDVLMNKVTKRVSGLRGTLEDHSLAKQTPECTKTMLKSVYFLPKYYKQ